ncbi:MAG: CBS domain-containing protein [Methanomassiliicoccales archaeon]|jgi:CBS domain-containing protein|nr:CBS domain-containing protein [Methanomassiliicoccales archaeon]
MTIKKVVKDLRVRDVMTKDVIAINEDTSIKDLKALFDKYDYNGFPVVRDGYLVGIVTKLDLLKTISPGKSVSKTNLLKLFAERVDEIMRRAVISINVDDDLKKAVEYMVEFKLRSLPVVDDEGKLVGMISRRDIMDHLLITDNDSQN